MPCLAICGDRRLEAFLGRVAHPEMDVGGGMARIDGEHLPEAADGLVVPLLAPGDVAQLAQALDVAGLSRERRERMLLVNGRDAEGELDAFVLGVELQCLPILTRAHR